MKKEIANLEKLVAGIDAKFANPDFAARAKPEVVEAERGRRDEFASKLERLRKQLERGDETDKSRARPLVYPPAW